MEFHQSEDAPVSLVEMRFHIPNTDGEDDPVENFHQKVLAHADVIQATGDSIAVFPEIQILTPRFVGRREGGREGGMRRKFCLCFSFRGRYTIKCYPTFLQLHGKTFDYKIPYDTINRLFLLPHNDQRQMFFVVSRDT